MKKILVILFVFLSSGIVLGQSQETLDKIQAAKIALITQRLELTPDQAEKFWPVYQEFTNKQLELRKEFQQMRAGLDPKTATEEENKRLLESGLRIKERQLDLEKTYAQRMQQVITNRQLMSLRKAEDDFREMLMDRVRQQQQQREQLRRDRLRSNDNLKRRQQN